MSPTASVTMTSLGKTTAFILSLFLSLNPVFGGQKNAFFSQLPLQNARNNKLPADQAEASRLLDLFQLKQSMSDLLAHDLGTQPNEGDTEAFEKPGITKRVFCNGFTGCGGRFRGRRRQQPPVNEVGKRVFCNTFGCSNRGRKRASEVASHINDDSSEMVQQKTMAFADGWSGGKLKRLFCNGYGGCQNMGKRWMALPNALSKGDGESELFTLPKDAVDSTTNKRFFSSGFDQEVDKLIDSMRR